jgi:hypothetical protein
MPHFRSPAGHGTWLSAWLPARPALAGFTGLLGRSGHPAVNGDTVVSRGDYYAAVCAVLWSERELLESLACTVVVEQLMTNAGAARQAADAIQHDSLHRLGLQEVLRAAMVEALQATTNGPADATLTDLAAAAPQPWQTMLVEHREALRTLAAELHSLAGFEQLSLREFLA